jgi:hypothetical protein
LLLEAILLLFPRHLKKQESNYPGGEMGRKSEAITFSVELSEFTLEQLMPLINLLAKIIAEKFIQEHLGNTKNIAGNEDIDVEQE